MDDKHVLNSQQPVGAQVEEAQGVGLLGLGSGLALGLATLTLTLTLILTPQGVGLLALLGPRVAAVVE